MIHGKSSIILSWSSIMQRFGYESLWSINFDMSRDEGENVVILCGLIVLFTLELVHML